MVAIRRSPYRRGEARTAILACARTTFTERGYHETSLKEIAAQADVSETLVYRYFGSKAGLFEESIIGPGRQFVERFLATWEDQPATGATDDKIREFVVEILAFVREHESLIFTWAIAGRTGATDIAADGTHGQGVRRLASAIAGTAPDAPEAADAEMAVALSIGLILSVVLLIDVLFAQDAANRDSDRLTEAVTRYVKAGFLAQLRSGTS